MSFIKQSLLEKRNGLGVLSGVLLGLSVPGMGLWPLAWVGLVPVLLALMACTSWRQALGQGLLWGGVYHGILFSWFFGLHPLAWMGLPDAMSMLITGAGWLVMTGIQTVIVGIIWVGAYRLRLCGQGVFIVMMPVVWVLGLWVLNQQPVGMPWGFLAYTQAGVDWIRESVYGLTFWGLEAAIVVANVLIALAWRRRSWVYLVLAGAVVTGLAVTQVIVSPVATNMAQLQPVIIQGNLTIEEERLGVTPAAREAYYTALIEQAQELTQHKARLFVLPEGVFTLTGMDIPGNLPISKNQAVISGGIKSDGEELYNGALFLEDEQPFQFMGKRYLVPFGETTPFIPEDWLIGVLEPLGIRYGRGFSSGKVEQPPISARNLKIGPLICFEAVYPNLVQRYHEQNVNLLVTFSNLGWYHQHPFLEKQFLALNQFRAAAAGVPLLLATNTGVSAIISEHGEILQQGPSGEAVFLTLKGSTPVTFGTK